MDCRRKKSWCKEASLLLILMCKNHLVTCRLDQLIWSMTTLLPTDGGNNTLSISFNREYLKIDPGQRCCMPHGVWLNLFLFCIRANLQITICPSERHKKEAARPVEIWYCKTLISDCVSLFSKWNMFSSGTWLIVLRDKITKSCFWERLWWIRSVLSK